MHVLIFFVQKPFLTKNYFPTAETNLTAWGPLYTNYKHLVQQLPFLGRGTTRVMKFHH